MPNEENMTSQELDQRQRLYPSYIKEY